MFHSTQEKVINEVVSDFELPPLIKDKGSFFVFRQEENSYEKKWSLFLGQLYDTAKLLKFYQIESFPKIFEEITDKAITELSKNGNPLVILYSPKNSPYRDSFVKAMQAFPKAFIVLMQNPSSPKLERL